MGMAENIRKNWGWPIMASVVCVCWEFFSDLAEVKLFADSISKEEQVSQPMIRVSKSSTSLPMNSRYSECSLKAWRRSTCCLPSSSAPAGSSVLLAKIPQGKAKSCGRLEISAGSRSSWGCLVLWGINDMLALLLCWVYGWGSQLQWSSLRFQRWTCLGWWFLDPCPSLLSICWSPCSCWYWSAAECSSLLPSFPMLPAFWCPSDSRRCLFACRILLSVPLWHQP